MILYSSPFLLISYTSHDGTDRCSRPILDTPFPTGPLLDIAWQRQARASSRPVPGLGSDQGYLKVSKKQSYPGGEGVALLLLKSHP